MAKRFYLDDAPPIVDRLNPFKYREYYAGELNPISVVANRTPDNLVRNKKPLYNSVLDGMLDFFAPGLTDILRIGDEENRYQQYKKAMKAGDREEALSYVNKPTPEELQHPLPTLEEQSDPNYWARQPELVRFNHRYKTEAKPYSRKMDWLNTTNSEGAQIAVSRLGEFGLTRRKDMFGKTSNDYKQWQMVDPEKTDTLNGKAYKQYVKECARFANLFNRRLGLPTTGDAWYRKGYYGDSVILNQNELENQNIQNIKDRVQSGDIVDMIGTHKNKPGRGNSHTGNIFKPLGNNGPTYIIHNIHGSINVDPIDDLMRGNLWRPTRIARPNKAPTRDFVLDESDPTYGYTTLAKRENIDNGIYTAIAGDSPWRIAHNNNLTLDEFYNLNPSARKGVYVGQKFKTRKR